jgi:hypothetical protein
MSREGLRLTRIASPSTDALGISSIRVRSFDPVRRTPAVQPVLEIVPAANVPNATGSGSGSPVSHGSFTAA